MPLHISSASASSDILWILFDRRSPCSVVRLRQDKYTGLVRAEPRKSRISSVRLGSRLLKDIVVLFSCPCVISMTSGPRLRGQVFRGRPINFLKPLQQCVCVNSLGLDARGVRFRKLWKLMICPIHRMRPEDKRTRHYKHAARGVFLWLRYRGVGS